MIIGCFNLIVKLFLVRFCVCLGNVWRFFKIVLIFGILFFYLFGDELFLNKGLYIFKLIFFLLVIVKVDLKIVNICLNC